MNAHTKGKGRPRSFDREKALSKALTVFWQKGFEHATLTELCVAMSINPPSLYAAFGSKADLFVEALNYYESYYWDHVWQAMHDEIELKNAIINFFYQTAEILCSQDIPCGCMVVLGSTSGSHEVKELDNHLKKLRLDGYKHFYNRLLVAHSRNELVPETNIECVAHTLNAFLSGLSLLVRDGISPDALKLVSAQAIGLVPLQILPRTSKENPAMSS